MRHLFAALARETLFENLMLRVVVCRSPRPVLVLLAASLLAGCTTTHPATERDDRGKPAYMWGRVLTHAIDLAAEDRADVDAGDAREAVVAIAAAVRERVEAALRDAETQGREPGDRVGADALAAVLFGDRGLRGDRADPSAQSRDLFDLDRVLASSRGTCLAVVVIGLAAGEAAGLQVAPVLTVGHARIAVSPGYLLDPATGGVALPPKEARPAGPEELVADLHANRASYRRAAGDLEGALVDADRAVALAPKLTVGRINRGVVLLDLGRPAEAQREFEAVEQGGAGTPASAYNLAITAARLESYGVAKHWYAVATERDPGHVRAWINLGVLHEALDEPVAARVAYQRALATEPDNADANKRLAGLTAQ